MRPSQGRLRKVDSEMRLPETVLFKRAGEIPLDPAKRKRETESKTIGIFLEPPEMLLKKEDLSFFRPQGLEEAVAVKVGGIIDGDSCFRLRHQAAVDPDKGGHPSRPYLFRKVLRNFISNLPIERAWPRHPWFRNFSFLQGLLP